jgi:hypothetical protein
MGNNALNVSPFHFPPVPPNRQYNIIFARVVSDALQQMIDIMLEIKKGYAMIIYFCNLFFVIFD